MNQSTEGRTTYLENRSCTQNSLLNSTTMTSFLAQRCKMMQQKICALRFPRTTFTRNHNTLIRLFVEHGIICCISDSKYMRWQFTEPPVLVQLHIFGIVNWVELERIDGDQDRTDVCVNISILEAGSQVIQQRCFVEVGQLTKVGIFLVARLIQKSEEVIAYELRVGSVWPSSASLSISF